MQKYLKGKLWESYGECIFFAEQPGRNNLIYFKHIASITLGKFKKLKEKKLTT